MIYNSELRKKVKSMVLGQVPIDQGYNKCSYI